MQKKTLALGALVMTVAGLGGTTAPALAATTRLVPAGAVASSGYRAVSVTPVRLDRFARSRVWIAHGYVPVAGWVRRDAEFGDWSRRNRRSVRNRQVMIFHKTLLKGVWVNVVNLPRRRCAATAVFGNVNVVCRHRGEVF